MSFILSKHLSTLSAQGPYRAVEFRSPLCSLEFEAPTDIVSNYSGPIWITCLDQTNKWNY